MPLWWFSKYSLTGPKTIVLSLRASYASRNNSSTMTQILHVKHPRLLARPVDLLLTISCLSKLVLIVLFITRGNEWSDRLELGGNELRRDIGLSSHTSTSHYTSSIYQQSCLKQPPQLKSEGSPKDSCCGGRTPIIGDRKRPSDRSWIESQWHKSDYLIRPKKD